jgi:hypothetical protein
MLQNSLKQLNVDAHKNEAHNPFSPYEQHGLDKFNPVTSKETALPDSRNIPGHVKPFPVEISPVAF